jgi:glycosyltransferase involved in cell wall biosynthesis
MPASSTTHLVLIPSYNTGERLFQTVLEALERWNPVWVVIDGSTDGTTERMVDMTERYPGLHVMVLPENQGKGAAVLRGLVEAVGQGFTHVLTFDSDGQHPAASITAYMSASTREPHALILGKPIFDSTAPRIRVLGRRVSNTLAHIETLSASIADSLFGMRVYPIQPLLEVMQSQRWMRRFDFDVEAAVRLVWRGAKPINISTPVRYLRPEEGGVSHFRYVRDNLLLTGMHVRLFVGFLIRLPMLAARWLRRAVTSDQ